MRRRGRTLRVLLVLWLPLALTCMTLAHAARISRGSEYWPLLSKLESRQADFRQASQSTQQFKDYEELLDAVADVAQPLLPAARNLSHSKTLDVMSNVPYVGKPVAIVQASALAFDAGLRVIVGLRDADARLVRPLNRAVENSNRLLQSRDDRDVPELVDSYLEAIQALDGLEEGVARGQKHVGEMLRLTRLLLKVLGHYPQADPNLVEGLQQQEQLLEQLETMQSQVLQRIASDREFFQSVLGALPHPPPAPVTRRAPGSGTAPEIPPGQRGSAEPAPAGMAPIAPGGGPGNITVAPAPPVAYVPPPAPSITVAEPTPPPEVGRPRPAVFVGGVVTLATGLGALAWVVTKMLLAQKMTGL